MSDSMSPEELAWAFSNAGRAPAAQQTTSEAFASRARQLEQEQQRGLAQQQHQQDLQYNQAIHAQDMATAQAQHGALMGQYTLLGQARGEMGAFNASTTDWKQGFVVGLALGALAAWIFRGR